jgi:RimJ/RimL family protein N-acetyltransferase
VQKSLPDRETVLPDSPYFLNSPRLTFRTWTIKDVRLACTLWGNVAVAQSIGGPFSESQIHERLAREIANQAQYHLQYWPVFLLGSGEFAGCCGIHPYDLEKQMFELGYHFLPRYWGKGLATEAARAVVAYAFGTLGLTSIFAGHHPNNIISRRILEKLGFQYLRDEIYPSTGLVNPLYLLTAGPSRL